MADKIKQITNEIDRLIKDAESGKKIPPQAISILESIIKDLSTMKKDKHKQELLSKLDNVAKISEEGNDSIAKMHEALIEAIKGIQMVAEAPNIEVKAPEVTVKPPEVTVRPPKVEVNVPEVKVPTVNVPPVNFPKEMKVTKPTWLPKLTVLTDIKKAIKGVDKTLSKFKLNTSSPKNPISVRLSDGNKFYKALGGFTSSAMNTIETFADANNVRRAALVDSDRHVQVDVLSTPSFETNDIEEASATVTYIGVESADGVWWIKKIDTSSGTSFGHASESTDPSYTTYSTAWTNRVSLTYGNYGEAF
jgi:hypothetical protein